MSARLVYLKLELKRACKKLPHIIAGAIVLLLLAVTVAFLASRMLYGDQAAGRITVGVVLPEGDAVAQKAVAMVSSLESVKSICDFEYMDKEEGVRKLKDGQLYAVMEVPEGFVQDIMNGTNTPVRIILPRGAGLESRIFKELTDAGAKTLVPYAVWLLTGFFRTVPVEIEEAARIDGANKMQTFIQVVLPLVAPGVVATAIYTFINTWNEFLYALILMNNTSKMTVAVALRSLDGAEILDWGDMMAASALVVLPSVIFFCLIQNKIAGGMSDGAVKS